jgi:tRNA threonylcarbamoyladenosine biosynthesis protein TsaE
LSRIQTGFHDPAIVGTPAAQWCAHWAGEADTEAFARRLAACPAICHATVALHGDLGAGKTTFVRHLLRALGVRGRIKSPTYAVVEPHSSSDCALMPDGEVLNIWHFDFYRFTDPREWEDAGFRELFASPGLKLVEWPERAAGLLGAVDAEITLSADDDMTEPAPPAADLDPDADAIDGARRVTLRALTPAGLRLLEAARA